MKTLSINFSHDASVCFMDNGVVTGYYKEERFSKKKRDVFPDLAIRFCLDRHPKPDFVLYHNMDYPEGHPNVRSYLVKSVGVPNDILVDTSMNHHLAHASCAFYNSGFDESLVFVVDGRGSITNDYTASECETVFKCAYPDRFETLQKNAFRASYKAYMDKKSDTKLVQALVDTYNISPLSFGQDMMENGKAMGLSAYGKTDLGDISDDIGYDNYKYTLVKLPIYKPYKDKIVEELTPDNYQPYADLALTVQKRTQEALLEMVKSHVKKTNIQNVCICGGYGMNVVANKFLIDSLPDVNFFFEPLSDDSGISIGMSKLFHHMNTNDMTKRKLETTSIHGEIHNLDEVEGKKVSFSDVAQLLKDNKSVAVFHKQSESGQRALGNRSILFNALNPDCKDIVNRIKKREWYRPFACIVLEEDAYKYFDMGVIKSSPFMTIAFKSIVDFIPGVTHVDKTCRIQTIDKNHHLYELLQEFKSITGHGILLNTSFNLAGQPLVENVSDAMETLKNSDLDHVLFSEIMTLV